MTPGAFVKQYLRAALGMGVGSLISIYGAIELAYGLTQLNGGLIIACGLLVFFAAVVAVLLNYAEQTGSVIPPEADNEQSRTLKLPKLEVVHWLTVILLGVFLFIPAITAFFGKAEVPGEASSELNESTSAAGQTDVDQTVASGEDRDDSQTEQAQKTRCPFSSKSEVLDEKGLRAIVDCQNDPNLTTAMKEEMYGGNKPLKVLVNGLAYDSVKVSGGYSIRINTEGLQVRAPIRTNETFLARLQGKNVKVEGFVKNINGDTVTLDYSKLMITDWLGF